MGEMAGEAAVAENKKKSGDGKASTAVVLKVDLHCRGCASKILKYVRGFDGVVDTKVVKEANELMVEGKLDAVKLQATKKKVEIVPISLHKQHQKKEKDNNEKSNKIGGDEAERGVHNFVIDKEKEVLTVKGAVDTKALADKLKKKMRRSVEIVPQKKEKEVAGGGKKNGGGRCKAEENGGAEFEGSRMEYYGPPQPQPGYGTGMGVVVVVVVGGYSYGFMCGEPVLSPQLFSDENPNAFCVR